MTSLDLESPAAPAVRRRAALNARVKTPTTDHPTQPVRRARTGAGARISFDHIVVYRVIVAGVIASIIAGVIASWDGLVHVAEWGIFPTELRLMLPILIDLPISVLALAALALKSRGRPGASAGMLALSIVFTAFAGVANFVYVVDSVGLDDYRDWTAAIFKALAPAIQLVMVEVLGVLVSKPAGERSKLAKAQDEVKELRAELRRATKRTRTEAVAS